MRAALESAITVFESSFDLGPDAPAVAGTRRWIKRVVTWTMDRYAELGARFATLASAISSVADFLKPIGDFSTALLVVSAPLSLALIFAAKRPGRLQPYLRTGAIFFAIEAMCSATWLGLEQVIPKAQAKGAIAAAIPALDDFQKSLLDKLAGLEALQRETVTSLGRIETSIGEVKKETSSDPRKELANLGVSWNSQNLSSALANRDVKIVELFLRGGMKVESHELVSLSTTPFSGEVANLLLRYSDNLQKLHCRDWSREEPFRAHYGIWVLEDYILKHLRRDWRAFYFSVCDPAPMRKKYKAQLDELKMPDSVLKKLTSEINARVSSCVSSIRSKNQALIAGEEDLGSVAMKLYAAGFYQNPENKDRGFNAPSQWFFMEVNEMKERGRRAVLEHWMRAGCQNGYPAPKREDWKIKPLEDLLAIIP